MLKLKSPLHYHLKITYRKVVAVYEEGGPDSVLLEAVQHLGCAGLGPVVKSQVNCNIILRLYQ